MVEIKKFPIWEDEAKLKIWFNDTKYWWDFHGSKIVISSTDTFETEEEAIKNWNNFCKVIEEFGRDWLNKGRAIGYRYGYDYGYEVGYEKGWKAND